MKCKAIHKKLIFFIEGELPQEEMKQIENHLVGCKECAAFADDMKKTLGTIENERITETNPFFYTRVKARLEAQSRQAQKPIWETVKAKVLQPAFFTILLIAGIYAGFKIGMPGNFNTVSANYSSENIFPYLDEMESESIEQFLME